MCQPGTRAHRRSTQRRWVRPHGGKRGWGLDLTPQQASEESRKLFSRQEVVKLSVGTFSHLHALPGAADRALDTTPPGNPECSAYRVRPDVARRGHGRAAPA